jgi:hypothetical protein
MNERFALIMTRTPSNVTPTPAEALHEAIDAAIIPLVQAIRAYAQAGDDEDALPGVRLIQAEQAFATAFNSTLVALHADMDDIHRGTNEMTYTERLYDLLLGQMIGQQLPSLLAERATLAHLRGEDPRQAVLGDVKLLRQWVSLAGRDAIEEATR